ncbi:MAG: DUF922 domain-containing protein [Pseudomonadota bacterium]
MVGALLFALTLAINAIVTSHSASASASRPSIKISTRTYPIRGSSVGELKRQMASRGPNGYWGFARWVVRWSATCRVTLTVRYILPRWVNQSGASPALRRRWRRMLTALRRHEHQHGRHGIAAAKELSRTRCRNNPHGIVARWSAADRAFDRRTIHGRTQGVRLD